MSSRARRGARYSSAPGCMMMMCCHFYVTRVSYFNERACCAMRLVGKISSIVSRDFAAARSAGPGGLLRRRNARGNTRGNANRIFPRRLRFFFCRPLVSWLAPTVLYSCKQTCRRHSSVRTPCPRSRRSARLEALAALQQRFPRSATASHRTNVRARRAVISNHYPFYGCGDKTAKSAPPTP